MMPFDKLSNTKNRVDICQLFGLVCDRLEHCYLNVREWTWIDLENNSSLNSLFNRQLNLVEHHPQIV
jgi:hypothetical protein